MTREYERVLTGVKRVLELICSRSQGQVRMIKDRLTRVTSIGSAIRLDADAVIHDAGQQLIGLVRCFQHNGEISQYIATATALLEHINARAAVDGRSPWDLHLFLLVASNDKPVDQVLDETYKYGAIHASVGVSVLEVPVQSEQVGELLDELARYGEFLSEARFSPDVARVAQFFAPMLPYTRNFVSTIRGPSTVYGNEELLRAVQTRLRDALPPLVVQLAGPDLEDLAKPLANLLQGDDKAAMLEQRVGSIERICVGTYRTLKDSGVHLGTTTLVVGGNATGKTSMIEFLQYCLSDDLERVDKDRNGKPNPTPMVNFLEKERCELEGSVYGKFYIRDEVRNMIRVKNGWQREMNFKGSLLRSFLLSQSYVARFVSADRDTRNAELLELLGVATDWVKDKANQLQRSANTARLREFVERCRNAKIDVKISQVNVATTTNATQHVIDAMDSLAALCLESTLPEDAIQRNPLLEELISASHEFQDLMARTMRDVKSRRAPSAEDIARLARAIDRYDRAKRECQLLVSRQPEFEEARNKLKSALESLDAPGFPQAPVQVRKLEESIGDIRRKLKVLRAFEQAITVDQYLNVLQDTARKIEANLDVISDEESLDFLCQVIPQASVRYVEPLVATCRAMSDVVQGLSSIKQSVLSEGVLTLIRQTCTDLAEQEKRLATELAKAGQPLPASPVSVMMEVESTVRQACQILRRPVPLGFRDALHTSGKEALLHGVEVLDDVTRCLADAGAVLAKIPEVGDCREDIIGIARAYEGGSVSGLLRDALAFDVVKTQQKVALEEADAIVDRLLRESYGPVLWEIVSALSLTRWPRLLPRLGYERPSSSRRATIRVEVQANWGGKADIGDIVNFAESSILAIAWFLVAYLTRGRFASNVVILDDPFIAMDPGQHEFALRRLLRLIRLCNKDCQIIVTVPPHPSVVKAARHFASAGTKQVTSDTLPDICVVNCRRDSATTCKFTARTAMVHPASSLEKYVTLRLSHISGPDSGETLREQPLELSL